LLIASVWIIAAYALPIPTDSGVFFGELGSVMGAIFTAGGLLIGIVALFTLGTVESKARQVASDVMQSVRQDMSSEMNCALAAYDSLFVARRSVEGSTPDYRVAERLIEAALEQRTDLPNAREWIAVTLADAAYGQFLFRHFNDNVRKAPTPLSGSVPDFFANAYGSIRWLKEVIDRTKVPAESLQWRKLLAEQYGIVSNWDEMLFQVQEVIENSSASEFGGYLIADLRSRFSSRSLAPLASAAIQHYSRPAPRAWATTLTFEVKYETRDGVHFVCRSLVMKEGADLA
jgi:hypothetical protein